MALKRRDILYDPIWGFFEPPAEIIKVLDTYEIQRLSRVTQLSLVNMIYRSANHTRLEHSIGVANLTDKVMNRFQVDRGAWPSEAIFDEYMPKWKNLKYFAEICGLVHDVGHGPFSHFVEPFLQLTKKESRKNEDIGRDVILGAYENIDKEFASKDIKFLRQVLKELAPELGFSLEDFANYITGAEEFTKYCQPIKAYLFIRRLISSPIDMDRIDFLNRDAYFVGLRVGVDASSIIQNLCLFLNDNGAMDLVLEETGIPHVENLLMCRDLMYATVYHSAVNRWGLAAVLRSAYRLYKDFNIPENVILRQTDATLLAMLKEGDQYTRGIAQRIEERRPYFRINELDYSWLNLANLPGGKDVTPSILKLENDPLRILGIEDEIKQKVDKYKQNSEEIDVMIDIPPALKFVEANVDVKILGENKPVPLTDVSDLARYVNERKRERRWILHVFTNAASDSIPYKEIIKEAQDILDIPPNSHPGRFLPKEPIEPNKTES